MFTYNYISIYIFAHIQIYEYLCMFTFNTSDKKCVYIQSYEHLYLCIHTII